MGLPSRYEDPTHGTCLTLHAALAYLRAKDVQAAAARDSIQVQRRDGSTRTLQPVDLPIGRMYPLHTLESALG